MRGRERREHPSDSGKQDAQHQVDTHHAAHRTQQRAMIARAAPAGYVLNVSVAKAGCNNAAGADRGSCHHPHAILRHAEVAQYYRCDGQHPQGISAVVQHSVCGI